MKETPLSLCERASLIENLKSGIRCDGRKVIEMRPIEINFGKDYGCCTVLLGETRVLAQVTSEVVEPRPSRPNEGKLSIAVHLSPMAASHFEQGRGNELMDELQQILDRNIKESRCLDVESLCIMAEESVWQLKVDVTVLNAAGNLGDACNLASVAALRHFHRPDVTVEEDGRVTVHTVDEREPIPTFLKKIPVCLTYALFMVNEKQCYIILDPTEKEERVMSGKFIVGLNPHGEITSLLFPGKVCLQKHHIMSCITKAFNKAKSIAETVMNLVEKDIEDRKTTKTTGYLNTLKSDVAYTKNLLMERVAGIRTLEQETTSFAKEEPSDVYIDDEGQEDNEEEMDSSDEEFSPESLQKTLPELQAEKKAKLNELKQENANSSSDDEMETDTVKLGKHDL